MAEDKTRRDNGEGTWAVKTNPKTGKKTIEYRIWIKGRRRSVSGESRKECRERADKLRFSGALKKSKLTVANLVDSYIEQDVKQTKSESTYANYKIYADSYIVPYFKKILVVDLTRHEIQEWVNDRSKKLKPSTVRRMYNILSSALQTAILDDLIQKNPADSVKTPTIERKSHVLVEKSAIENIIDYDTESDSLALLAKITLLTGLRRGEALGIKWTDINFTEGIVSIKRAIVKGNKQVIVKKPKTKSSVRDVPLPKMVVSMLKKHKIEQGLIKKEAGEFYQDQKYVFANEIGHHFHPDSPRNGVSRLLKAVDIPNTTVHSLRHSYASILFEMGESEKVIQSVLGHSSVKTTLDIYVHLKQQQKKSAADKFDSLVGKK